MGLAIENCKNVNSFCSSSLSPSFNAVDSLDKSGTRAGLHDQCKETSVDENHTHKLNIPIHVAEGKIANLKGQPIILV